MLPCALFQPVICETSVAVTFLEKEAGGRA